MDAALRYRLVESTGLKLIKRIVEKEFVDIWELLPESWQLESEGTCCHSMWPYRSLVCGLNSMPRWPRFTQPPILRRPPQLFAYLQMVTKVSRTFKGSAWASYDVAYHPSHGSLNWGVVDPALYNEAFAGRAKLVP